MTSALNTAIIEGHNEEMFNMLMTKIIDSNEYDHFIHSSIYKAMIKVFLPNKAEIQSNQNSSSFNRQIDETSPDELRQGMIDLVHKTMDEQVNQTIEPRVKSLEAVLFKTSQADRNRLFDHIYEKIKQVDKKFSIENENLQKSLHRQEKRSEIINLQAE